MSPKQPTSLAEQLPVAAESHKAQNLFEVAQAQLERGITAIKLDDDIATILTQPPHELIINVPVTLAHGATHLFKGYRVQHNNILGPV
jgi:glutamate dehydrogenase (NAD(P)+)